MEFFFAQQKVFFRPGVYRKRNIFLSFIGENLWIFRNFASSYSSLEKRISFLPNILYFL